ncbi:MAG: hypothetical protein DI538_15280 [Azospira oryzae]|nr:MAG: hypothetical protein DI538_15280 [Azospira oryzae]
MAFQANLFKTRPSPTNLNSLRKEASPGTSFLSLIQIDDMKAEIGKYYRITLLDGKVEKLRFKGEAPGNVLQFVRKDGSVFSVPTGGFSSMKETDKKS